MKKLGLALSVLTAVALIAAAGNLVAQEEPTSGEMSGQVLEIDRGDSRLTLQVEDESVGMRVDDRAVPGWYTKIEVGNIVKVSWKLTEQGRTIVSITKLRD